MKRLLIFLISLFFIFTAYSQDAQITISCPAKVGVGQAFSVQYTVNQQGSSPKVANTSNISVLNGPSTSTSTSISWVNGSMTQSVSNGYTYTMKANAVGTFNIPTFTITCNGKTYSSPAKAIVVQQDAVQNQNNRQNQNYDPFAGIDEFFNGGGQQQQQQQQTVPQEISNNDVFVRVFLNKTEAYKGEPVIATIKMFTAVDVAGMEDFKVPAFNDFYAQEIETSNQITFTRENVNNRVFNTAVLKKYILYPRVTGTAKIEASKLELVIRQIVGRGWFSSYNNVKKTIVSGESSVNVKALPDNAPASFKGAVGKFNIKLEKSADEVTVNDAITVKITLNGTGNFNMIEVPKINFPKEFETYDPDITNNTSVGANGLTGSKTWEYTVIPRYPGNFKFGKMNFSYFDLSSGKYVTQNIDDISIAVKKGAGDNNDYKYTPQQNVEFIGNEEIKFIKNNSLNLKQNYIPLISKWYFPIFLAIPLIILIGAIIILRKKIKENSDLAKVKQKKANKVSQKRLKKAKKFILDNNKTAFYKEVISALWGYASDKLNIPTANITKTNIRSELETKNIENETINDFINIIEKCEYAHFAPDSPEIELNFVFKEASDIIEKLENKIK